MSQYTTSSIYSDASTSRESTTITDSDYEEIHVPVLIIGSGAAGARLGIELREQGIEPLVIGKRGHGDAHTTWAAGGINAALGSRDPEDCWEIHAADTLREGHFINDPEAVELVAREMPNRIRELDDWGMEFARTDEGTIQQRYFGAQSFRRTCFVGDRTGEAMLETLVDRAQSLGVPYRENVMITRLLSDGDHVEGAVGFDMETGEFLAFVTDHVAVAAGGSSAMYDRHSSREAENNGDGPALALDAGAELLDMEFVQFHPTGMVGDRYGDEWDGRLVTEAVRGEGGRLYNTDSERFMERYSPEQMELDARDVVARAIFQEINDGRGTESGGVYLDISHRDDEYIRERLPSMVDRFADLGVDITSEPMEVAPTAHYTMGGVDIDPHTGETSVDGLYAVGESTAGVHGANRLGGNSLAETVAVAKPVGQHLAEQLQSGGLAADGGTEAPITDTTAELSVQMRAHAEREFAALARLETADGKPTPKDLLDELGEVLQRDAGIIRDDERLRRALTSIRGLRDSVDDLRIEGDRTSRNFELAVDLGFSLAVAEATVRTALERIESRGAHYRADYPEPDETFRENLIVSDGDRGLAIRRRSVGQPSEPVREALDEQHELDYHHLE